MRELVVKDPPADVADFEVDGDPVTRLSLGTCPWDAQTFRALWARLGRPADLVLHGEGFTNDHLETLLDVPLNALALYGTSVSPQGLAALAASRQSSLHLLLVSDFGEDTRQLDDDVLVTLVDSLACLETLVAWWARVTSTGLEKLPKSRSLRSLYLSGCVVQGTLGTVRDLPALERLNLKATGAGDAAVESLRGAARLRELDLRETAVTDSCIEALLSIDSLRTCTHVGTNITPEGGERLAAALQQRPPRAG